jgi:hypothetical protein
MRFGPEAFPENAGATAKLKAELEAKIIRQFNASEAIPEELKPGILGKLFDNPAVLLNPRSNQLNYVPRLSTKPRPESDRISDTTSKCSSHRSIILPHSTPFGRFAIAKQACRNNTFVCIRRRPIGVTANGQRLISDVVRSTRLRINPESSLAPGR